MSKFTKELEELQAKGIITADIAQRIREYYDKPGSGTSKMLIAFGVIGSLLVGMGAVLIIAHNWDDFNNAVKLTFGLAPLLVAQAICVYLLVKKIESQAWRESASVVLVFAVAASMSIVGQVYNMSGAIDRFIMAWTLLTLPLCYIMRSNVASLLYWIGITWYVLDVTFDHSGKLENYYYWLLAAGAMPWYILQLRRAPTSNGVAWHNWLIAMSLLIAIGTTGLEPDDLWIPVSITGSSVLMLVGQLAPFQAGRTISNSWLFIGSGGTIWLLLFMTFEWPDNIDLTVSDSPWWYSTGLIMWMALFALATFLLVIVGNRIGFKNVMAKSYTFIAFLALFGLGIDSPDLARLLTNVVLLALGAYTIREGAKADKLWQMNYGLLILTALIGCRFFDTDMSFVVRGVLFMAIGLGFFGMNYYVVRKRKAVQA